MMIKKIKKVMICIIVAALTMTQTPQIAKARSSSSSDNGDGTFTNPNVYLDVPDIDMIRVGENYYMVSTTMHMSPGCPILKSTDLVNWETVNYVFDRLTDSDAANLVNGKSMYGAGQWAASIKYHNNMYYVAFNSNTTGTAYIFSTDDIENGSWERVELGKSYHDCALFWDDANDGACYLVYGNNTIQYVELNDDLSGVKSGGRSGVMFEGNIDENGKDLFPGAGGLGNEGSHVYYKDGYYYVFTINAHPNVRTEVVHRSSVFPGTNADWQTRIVLKTRFDNFGINNLGNGVAQGGIIDTTSGEWYCYMFQDHDGIGRVPVLTKLTWTKDGWPAAGENGDTKTVANIMDIPGIPSGKKTLVKSDEFYNDAVHKQYEAVQAVNTEEADYNGSNLDMCWEWNHNPDNTKWSLTEREGYLRLYTAGTAKGWLNARNTLTQRTYGPTSSYAISMDVSNMNSGDIAGLGGLANKYGYVGVRCNDDGTKEIIMVDGSDNSGANNADAAVSEAVACENDTVYLKADFLFADTEKEYDQMDFYYSYNGKTWNKIGTSAHTKYDIVPMFMGIRVGIFNYATTNEGGYVDVDYFHVTSELTGENEYMGDASAELKVSADNDTISLYMDNITSSDYAGIKASIVLPKELNVRSVDYNTAAIKNGEGSYTYENGRLILNVKGKNVTFDAANRLFATIHVKSNTSVTSDKAGKIKTDYIYVDDGYIDYNVSNCNPDIIIKTYVPDPTTQTDNPPVQSVTAPPDNSSSASPFVTKVTLAKVKGISAKKKGLKKAVVKWKKVSGAEKYEVIYSADKKMKKAVKKLSVKKTTVTIKKLKNKKTYYVKVRACAKNSDGSMSYGKYSAKKKVK